MIKRQDLWNKFQKIKKESVSDWGLCLTILSPHNARRGADKSSKAMPTKGTGPSEHIEMKLAQRDAEDF